MNATVDQAERQTASRPLDMNDVLSASYTAVDLPPKPSAKNSAVLLVDIQYMASPDYLKEKAVAAGLATDDVKAALSDYDKRFWDAVGHCQKVLDAARKANVPAVHVKLQTLDRDGRDVGILHRRLNWRYPPGSASTEFVEQTKPQPGEIVITKTASGAFTGTALDNTLRNMGIVHLYVCGFMVDECVETTARVALDYGYWTSIISDATAGYHQHQWEKTIQKFVSLGFATPADRVIDTFESFATS